MMASVLGPCRSLWQRRYSLHQGWCEPVVHSLLCMSVDRGSAPGVGLGRTSRKADDSGQDRGQLGLQVLTCAEGGGGAVVMALA